MSLNVAGVYGKCSCGYPLQPDWFEERECVIQEGRLHYTNRYRMAVNVLYCSNCLSTYGIDDTFDGKWYTRDKNGV